MSAIGLLSQSLRRLRAVAWYFLAVVDFDLFGYDIGGELLTEGVRTFTLGSPSHLRVLALCHFGEELSGFLACLGNR